ncbi:MAG: hypothetical protein ACI4KF_00620 [Huintestinicola sp.]
MRYTIIEIHDEDHGCEEVLSDIIMDEVLLEDSEGRRVWRRIPDKWLGDNGLDCGDVIELE